MKTYVSARRASEVTVTVWITSAHRHLRHIAYHSPAGMEWGYAGSGPADLALSILVDALWEGRRWQSHPGRGSLAFSRRLSRSPHDSHAWDLHQAFKREVIAQLDGHEFALTEAQVRERISQHESPDAALSL